MDTTCNMQAQAPPRPAIDLVAEGLWRIAAGKFCNESWMTLPEEQKAWWRDWCHRMCETMDDMLSGFLLLAASGDQPADRSTVHPARPCSLVLRRPGQEPSSHPVRSKPCRGLPAIRSHSSNLASRFSAFVCEQLGSDPEQGVREMVRVTGRGGVVAAALWDFHGVPKSRT